MTLPRPLRRVADVPTPRLTIMQTLDDARSGLDHLSPIQLLAAMKHDAMRGFDQRLVVVCNEGYSSSLAALSLQQLGFSGATELIDGMAGWVSAGLPTVAPEHHRISR